MPSPLKSPTATDSGPLPVAGLVAAGRKGSVPVAQQNRYRARVSTVLVRHGQVRLAVPVEVPYRHGKGIGARRRARRHGRKGSIPVAQQNRHRAVLL